jgi:lipoprotein-anchoring transpeptidase ErfK/SrfK
MLRPTFTAALLGLVAASACHHAPPGGIQPLQQAQPGTQGPRPAGQEPQPLDEPLPPAKSRALQIDLASQRFSYFEDDRLVRSGEISAGTTEHPTPTGEFRVLSKQKDKVSHSYTNYFDMPTPMPYSLQFYGPYYIHEGWLPGRPDSHGCVRLHYEDARFLFERMKRGDPVKITEAGVASGWQVEQTPVPELSAARDDWLGLDDPRGGWRGVFATPRTRSAARPGSRPFRNRT